ncbi:F-box protein At1g67340 [Impatiens glandulifera]|uniref:F-box protein At1g67340 n=1 Tax=Impatiens glandulifera TaxID=253017 RepID=UPI001FB06A07|nr:F-box protein At1g67340 [Impatiens glandulifera]
MKTRSGLRYRTEEMNCERLILRTKKRIRRLDIVRNGDCFEKLPDDLVLSILCKLSASAKSPSDFFSASLTCKRFRDLAMNSVVLSRASPNIVAVRAKIWCDSAHRFLKICADSGNVEACYMLGMIRFYCLQNRGTGACMMAKAAMSSYAPALYSLAVIQFNGSGGSKNDKDLRAGVALCARAAFLGHVDALRELGHCFQDGYGIRKNIVEGRRFLVQANALEYAAAASAKTTVRFQLTPPSNNSGSFPLLSDFGCDVPAQEAHPANRFLTEWFANRVGNGGGDEACSVLRLCSHVGCGRPETRRHEFRRCSVCGRANYCSRACQAMDWKMRHKVECGPAEFWVEEEEDDGGNGNGELEEEEEEEEDEVEE